MAERRLAFVLDGRDRLSPVFRRAGESAEDFRRRVQRASDGASGDITTFTRDADGRLRDLRGRFLTTADAARVMGRSLTAPTARVADWSAVSTTASQVGERLLGTLISLAPAAIPAAAALTPLAAGAGAVGVATLAFTAALIPQIGALSEASEAQTKYEDAVAKSGARSEEAVTAHREYLRTVAEMPPETRQAAAALGLLKDEYKEWSNALAGDTMAPLTKGMGILTALLPKTSGLVKGTSGELDRMMTIIGGAMESPGLDRLNTKFTDFAVGTLRRVNDGLVSLTQKDTGKVGAGAAEFMAYARTQGPLAADTLEQIALSLVHVLDAGADVGVGMLQVVNVLASLIAAVPPGAISALLQLAVAIKLVRLAVAGAAASRAAMAAVSAEIVTMRAAAAGTPGRLAAVGAAIGSLSKGAKIALAGTGIGLLVLGIAKLAGLGKTAPPDVDKLTTSLKRLADSGKFSGELQDTFGDMDGLIAKVRKLQTETDKAKQTAFGVRVPVLDDVADWIANNINDMSKGGESLSALKGDFDSLDQAMAGMVGSGHATQAAQDFNMMKAALVKAGVSTKEINALFPEYQAAVSSAAAEQRLAAASMGLFGTQAQQVQAKLDAQKSSADGLRQSLVALNDVNRQGLGGMIGFEAALDAATATIKGHRDALSMTGGQLNLNSEKARTAASALTDLAAKTDEAATTARQSGASWETVNGIYARGRSALIRTADAMGLNRNQAKALADQILQTPNKTAKLKGDLEDLETKLAAAKTKLRSVPDSRKAQVRAEIGDLQRKLGQARYELSTLRDRSVTVTTRYVVVGDSSAARKAGSHGSQLKYADGGLVGFPTGGMVTGPGTGTSDSILARVSNGEFVVRAKSVAKYGARFLAAINEGRLGMAATVGGAGGNMAGAGAEAGRGLSAGLRGAAGEVDASARVMAAAVTAGVRAELEIASPSKKMKALMKDVGKGLILGLTGEKSKISATAKDLVKDIWAAWAGVKTNKDSKLVARVTKDTKKLQALATARDKLAARIKEAKEYAAGVRDTARRDASLGSLGIEEGQVTAGSIKAGLQQKLVKLKAFTSYIGILAKRGLSKVLLRQILDMGPEQGYAYANALAGASSSTLKSINATQAALTSGTDKLGKTGADLLYDSGKNAAKGYLKGLDSQQDAIEKQMLKIAKSMDKAIRKALGIRSPSTVAAVPGGHFTEGIAKGAVDALPVLDRAMDTVAGRMASMRPVVGRPAVVGAGAGVQPIQATITVQSLDPLAAAREVQKLLLKLGRSQGGAVTLQVGR
ncbi:hypothetical protein [Streptomyces californicus]|uniref:hypothetical protein n=1 Tax=Streptomyces californicus TaxID=67351 RepID=UPI00371A8082